MTSPWAWLLLVTMVTLTTGRLATAHFYPGRPGVNPPPPYDRDKEHGAGHCPAACTCEWNVFKTQTDLDAGLFTVNCSGKGLMDFPPELTNQTQALIMSDNKLQNLTDLPRLSGLLLLDINQNWLRVIDNGWVFEHVKKLRSLSLRDNSIREIQHGSFNGLSQLRELDLSHNIIKRIEVHAFTGLTNLRKLRLDHNQLYRPQREWFLPLSSLSHLNLDNNQLTDLADHTFDPLGRLQHLDLSHNFLLVLKRQALSGLSNLNVLNLSGNRRLREVPGTSLNFLPNLDILLMDDTGVNRLPSLAFSWLKVKEMSLSYMPQLRVIESTAFFNLTLLKTLQIHDNPKLVYLHPHAFLGLPRLTHLILHNNGLVVIPGTLIASLPSLSDLQLHHNPLQCDCNIFWLRQELEHVRQHLRHHIKTPSSRTHQSPSSFESLSQNSDFLQATKHLNNSGISVLNNTRSTVPPSISTSITSTTTEGQLRTLISEPGRVACSFPSSPSANEGSSSSSIPLVQLALQYFPPTCPPSSLPLFPGQINVTLGAELWLECQGLGVPQPRISWILPGGLEVNGTTRIEPHDHPILQASDLHRNAADIEKRYKDATTRGASRIKSSARIVEETLLYIPSVSLADAGRYGCRAASELGQHFSSTVVYVHNQPLELQEVEVSDNFITLMWRGSIPRTQIKDFQIYYRNLPLLTFETHFVKNSTYGVDGGSYLNTGGGARPSVSYTYNTDPDYGIVGSSSTDKNSPSISSTPTLQDQTQYKVIALHGSVHRRTIRGLSPSTKYEVCLVYKQSLIVQCQNYTTAGQVHVVAATTSGGITRISRAQVGIGIGAGIGTVLLLTVLLTLVARRMRQRKEYLDPLDGEDKSAIPLEGLVTPVNVPSTPLTSSRTALLTNANV